VDRREPGIEVDGLLVFGDSLRHLVPAAQSEAEVKVGHRVLGIEIDGLLVFGDSLLHLVLAA
jgi:hypothetical protein